MGFKTGLLVGAGVGYVLGARAGRARYEQIRRIWDQINGNPQVQRVTERAKEAAKEVAGDSAKRSLSAVQHGVGKASTAVKERLHKDDNATDDVVDLVETQSTSPEPNPPATTAKKAFDTSNDKKS
jgi:hypothetical protein